MQSRSVLLRNCSSFSLWGNDNDVDDDEVDDNVSVDDDRDTILLASSNSAKMSERCSNGGMEVVLGWAWFTSLSSCSCCRGSLSFGFFGGGACSDEGMSLLLLSFWLSGASAVVTVVVVVAVRRVRFLFLRETTGVCGYCC